MTCCLKNSVGIWTFGINPTEVLLQGYHPEYGTEGMIDRTNRAVDGLDDLVDGFEYQYLYEINESNAELIKNTLGPKDIYSIIVNLCMMSQYREGDYTNPDKRKRNEVISLSKSAIDLAAQFKSQIILKYSCPVFNPKDVKEYHKAWCLLLEGLQECLEYANQKKVIICLNHKPQSLLAGWIKQSDLYVINKLKSQNIDVSFMKINMNCPELNQQNVSLAEYSAFLGMEKYLGHIHANPGCNDLHGNSPELENTILFAHTLQNIGYGKKGERIGFDVFSYSGHQIETVKNSIKYWNYCSEIASKLNLKVTGLDSSKSDNMDIYRKIYKEVGIKSGII